jgi:hypothetical protein
MSWNGNWAWALPLIVVTLIVHVVGLAVINLRMVRVHSNICASHRFLFIFVMTITALLAILLLAFEATLWAAAYTGLGALPDIRAAMLYSFNAFTAYGHTELALAPHWRLMGALEALDGVLLFGLTTAFLYGHICRVWPRDLIPPAPRDREYSPGA